MGCQLMNIKKVERCPASAMLNAEEVFDRCIFLKECDSFEQVPIIGMASVEITDKLENKQRMFTTKLVFKTADSPGFEKDMYCYRLTSVSGKSFMLGTKSRPYSLFNSSEVIPGAPSDKAGCTCTVTYINLFSLLTILD